MEAEYSKKISAPDLIKHIKGPLACSLHIEMDFKNNKEQNKKQTINNRVHKYGGNIGLHVHELKGPTLSRHLKQQSRRQKRKQRRRDERRSPIVHSIFCLRTSDKNKMKKNKRIEEDVYCVLET